MIGPGTKVEIKLLLLQGKMQKTEPSSVFKGDLCRLASVTLARPSVLKRGITRSALQQRQYLLLYVIYIGNNRLLAVHQHMA